MHSQSPRLAISPDLIGVIWRGETNAEDFLVILITCSKHPQMTAINIRQSAQPTVLAKQKHVYRKFVGYGVLDCFVTQ